MYPEPCAANGFLAEHVRLLRRSFQRWVGRDFFDPRVPEPQAGRWLYDAPFAVLSHSVDADPVFTYANRTALALFEMSWPELIGLPSRLSAEPVGQAERARLLAEVAARGVIENYSGVRISRTGRRFLIKDVAVWNLVNDTGEYRGQAATYGEWVPIDRTGAGPW